MALIIEVLTLILFSTFIAAFIGLYFYFTRNFKFWHKLGIPYIKPTPFVGNLKDLVLQKASAGKHFQKIYNENSDKPYVGIFTFDKPMLVIRDVELLKNVLVRDSHNFTDHIMTLNITEDPLLARNTLALKGKRWHHVRTNLSPAFTSVKLKMMFPLVDTCAKELADYLDKTTAGGSSAQVLDMMSRYSAEVIASCAFGINGKSFSEPNAEFRLRLQSVIHISFRTGLAWLTSFFAPQVKSLLKLKVLDDSLENYFRNIVWGTVEYREKHGITRKDFLDSLMELRNKGRDDSKKCGMYAKTEEKDPIFVAGYETSASTLSFALHELAIHPEIQTRLRIEIMEVLNEHNGEVTFDGIQGMAYLDKVVSETQRKYPISGYLDRVCCNDYNLPAPSGIGTVTLPAGTGIIVPILGLHYDPRYFPEPEKFDPDRFTEENKETRMNYTYMPFGEGPRTCIGMRFALMEMKTALCHILSRFEVAPCKDTPVRIDFDPKCLILTIKGELLLSFKRMKF